MLGYSALSKVVYFDSKSNSVPCLYLSIPSHLQCVKTDLNALMGIAKIIE